MQPCCHAASLPYLTSRPGRPHPTPPQPAHSPSHISPQALGLAFRAYLVAGSGGAAPGSGAAALATKLASAGYRLYVDPLTVQARATPAAASILCAALLWRAGPASEEQLCCITWAHTAAAAAVWLPGRLLCAARRRACLPPLDPFRG